MSSSDVSMFAEDHEKLLGYHKDMPNDEYHSGPGLSKSGLDLIDKSIRHFIMRDEVRRETDAMVLGTAVHSAILEPHTWPGQYIRGPEDCDMRTKEWKAALQTAVSNSQTIMKPENYDKVENIATSALSIEDPLIDDIKNLNGMAESSIFMRDGETGLLVKCRPDFLIPERRTILDVKTTKDASPDGFARSCGMFRYDVQDAMYTDIVEKMFGGQWDFVFLAVENVPPYNAGIYRLSKKDKENGRILYRRNMAKAAEYFGGYSKVTAYSDKLETIQIPYYFRRNL